MSKVTWLGDAVSDCKSDVTKQAACHSFAATLATVTGSAPLGTYYKDKCLEYLCSTGSMPTPADIPSCKDDQANKDKCAAFGSTLAVATGSAPLGPFYRDQCLEYLCANGQMPTPKDMPPPPALPPPPPPPAPAPTPQTKPPTTLAPAGAAPSTPWGWIVAGTVAVLGLAWYFVPASRPWKDNPRKLVYPSGKAGIFYPEHTPTDRDLDVFFDAYVEAALWSSTDESTPSGGYPLDKSYGRSDFTREALHKMRKDANAFALAHADLIRGRESQAGHDFWLTRNHHGAGFWDGDWPKPAADILTKDSHAYGEQHIYVSRKRLHVQ